MNPRGHSVHLDVHCWSSYKSYTPKDGIFFFHVNWVITACSLLLPEIDLQLGTEKNEP